MVVTFNSTFQRLKDLTILLILNSLRVPICVASSFFGTICFLYPTSILIHCLSHSKSFVFCLMLKLILNLFATRQASMEFFTWSLPKISCLCRLTVFVLIESVPAIFFTCQTSVYKRLNTCFSLTDSIFVSFCLSNSIICPLMEFIIKHLAGISNNKGL